MISQVVCIAALAALSAASVIPVHHAPQPYKFGYDIKDKHGEQYRQEEGNGGHAVKGSYGFTDARGVKRQVDYVADHAGFRAQVKTSEPGTANQNPAAVLMVSNAPYAGGVGLGGFGYGGYGIGVATPVAGYGLGGAVPVTRYGSGIATSVAGYGPGVAAPVAGYGLGNGVGVGYGSAGLGYARRGY